MTHPFDSLRPYRFVSLTTFRVSGEPVPTAVWFVLHGGAVYVETGETTGKAKRIRRDPHVTLAPCTPWGSTSGSAISAVATDLGPAASTQIGRLLLHRYGPLQRFRDRLLNRRDITPTFLEILPA